MYTDDTEDSFEKDSQRTMIKLKKHDYLEKFFII